MPARVVTAAIVTCWLASATPAPAQVLSDEDGIRAAIGRYFQGHATADSTIMRSAFLPTAHIEGIRDGKFSSWTLNEYVALSRGQPAADEATRRRRIDQIRISGTAANATATLEHGPTTFTDFFVLLKVDGSWRIANKVYYAARKTP